MVSLAGAAACAAMATRTATVIPSTASDLRVGPPDPLPSTRLRMTPPLIESQQLRRVAAEDGRFVRIRHLQCVNAREHFLQAADLVRVVAAGEDVIGAGELDGQPQCPWIEVDGVVVELLEICARRMVNILTT